MQAECLFERRAGLRAVGEDGEDAKLDRAEQSLGGEEAHADLQDLVGAGIGRDGRGLREGGGH